MKLRPWDATGFDYGDTAKFSNELVLRLRSLASQFLLCGLSDRLTEVNVRL